MLREQFTTTQTITKLREAEVLLSHGMAVLRATRQLEISEKTCHH